MCQSKTSYKKTPSGLHYRIIKKGKGEKINKSDYLEINYLTKIDSDTIFDSNFNKPYFFLCGQEVGLKGWDEALLMLNVGDSAEFIIPPHLAYGDKKIGNIKPNSFVNYNIKVVSKKIIFFNNSHTDTIKIADGVKKIINKKGNGKLVQKTNYVKLNFTGYIINSKGNKRIFESSYINNQHAFVQLGGSRFIKGLDIAISTMQIGEKSTVVVEEYMGYGDEKIGVIPKNTRLYYDIELENEYNPFLNFSTDTLISNANIKYFKSNATISNGLSFNNEKVLQFDLMIYYLNASNEKIIVSDSKILNTPLFILYNSKLISPKLLEILKNTQQNQNYLAVMPYEDCFEIRNQKNLSKFSFFYYQISNTKLIDYPFFKIPTNQDTVYLENKIKYITVKQTVGNETKFTNNKKIQLAYTGYYIKDNTRVIFSTSRENGKPLEFEFDDEKIIPGLLKGVSTISKGEARIVVVPYQFAYGENGIPKAGIPPKTDLIFEVEAIDIK